MNSWGEKDIAQFLIFDYFDTVRQFAWMQDINEKTFFEGLGRHVAQYDKYKIIIDFLDKFFFIRYLKDKINKKDGKKIILFEETKYFPIVLASRKRYLSALMVQGFKDRLFSAKHSMGYIRTNDIDYLVLRYLESKNVSYLYELLLKVEEKLKIANPDYLVLTYDVFPIQRAMILVAKRMGIPTLVIQHSINQRTNPLFDFKVADCVLVWGEYFKDMCVEQAGRNPEDVYILGYPSTFEKIPSVKKENDNYTVCYLGQDIERHNKDLLPMKLETIAHLFNICKKLNLKFLYRPHHAEDRDLIKEKLPDINFTSKEETLEQTFKRTDICISFFSTSLVEAAMRGKITLQLMNYPLAVDNFEQLGITTKSYQTLNQLEEYLKEIANAPDINMFKSSFNNNYIETKYNPGERFLEIMEEIGKRSGKTF